MDYLLAVQKNCESGGRAAIVTYREPLGTELKHYLDEVHMDVANIIYEDTQELESLMKEDSAATIIGGAHAVEVAGKLHKKSVLIYPGQSAIRDSMITGRQRLACLQVPWRKKWWWVRSTPSTPQKIFRMKTEDKSENRCDVVTTG